MNCVPVPTLPLFPEAAAAVVAAGGAAAAVAGGVAPAAAADCDEKKARAAMLFGCASPWPQPPSRVWAITGPAHRPLLKPQHDEAQSASEEQGPVMNCVPCERTSRMRLSSRKTVDDSVEYILYIVVEN